MCLTIPAKVIEINEGKKTAKIDSGGDVKEVNVSFIMPLKIGEWILYVNDLAIKKITDDDAFELLRFLESNKTIDLSKLSDKFQEIIKASKIRELTKEEIIYLLEAEGEEKEALFSEANVVRKTYIKDFICIHGIIEFSNYCRNNCSYCGLRRDNSGAVRYRMSVEEIIQTALDAVNNKGYKLLVLQSGEDPSYTEDMLVEIIKGIKAGCKAHIIMSVGERGYECYRRMKEAGASGVLFRFESSNPELFNHIHSDGGGANKNLENRLEHLKFMKELGYYIATGSIIGLPGQTTADLADDVLMIKKWANMVSMGPFVPGKNTPFEKEPHGDPEVNFKMISVLRLIMKYARIPVVTALETLAGDDGRKRAFFAGANSLMFNLTPDKYRPHYKIYDNKFHDKNSIWEKYGLFKYEESYKMIEENMLKELEKNKI